MNETERDIWPPELNRARIFNAEGAEIGWIVRERDGYLVLDFGRSFWASPRWVETIEAAHVFFPDAVRVQEAEG